MNMSLWRVVVLSVLAVAALAAPSAASADLSVDVQINDVSGVYDWETVPLGPANGGPMPGPSTGVACPGLPEGFFPANSVGAAFSRLQNTSGVWSFTASGAFPLSFGSGVDFYFAPVTHPALAAVPAAGYDPDNPEVGWHLWIDTRFIDLRSYPTALCLALEDGDDIVVQASRLSTLEGANYVPSSPLVRIEGMPEVVAPSQDVTVSVFEYRPSSWDSTFSAGVPTAAAGYTIGVPDRGQGVSWYTLSELLGEDATTDANGEVTFGVPLFFQFGAQDEPVSAAFRAAPAMPGLGSFEWEDGSFPPAGSNNSALSTVASGCVFRGFANSTCRAASVAPAAVEAFAAQARGTISPPKTVEVTPVEGRATITSVEVAGAARDDYIVSHDGCEGRTVDAGSSTPPGGQNPITHPASCEVSVRFAPSATGPSAATLVVTSTARTAVSETPLSGSGSEQSAGPQGPPGAPGSAGPQGPGGSNGADGAVGPAGAKGDAGTPGPAGDQGPAGPRGPAGKNGVCTLVRGKQGPRRIVCEVRGADRAGRATLMRAGRVYARGTSGSLRTTRRVPSGSYQLRYRSDGRVTTVTVTVA